MKDANDPGTRDLIDEAPYLVISQTKKGFREFKEEGWYHRGEQHIETMYNWHWNRRIEKAQRFDLDKLPALITEVAKRRTATVGMVIGNELIVLGVNRYPL